MFVARALTLDTLVAAAVLPACLQGSSCCALLRQWEPLLLNWHDSSTAAKQELVDKLGSAELAFYLACRDSAAYKEVDWCCFACCYYCYCLCYHCCLTAAKAKLHSHLSCSTLLSRPYDRQSQTRQHVGACNVSHSLQRFIAGAG
jgi:hypothetical protein